MKRRLHSPPRLAGPSSRSDLCRGASFHGETEVALSIGGAATSLGNPVDLAFDGLDLFVAEKSNSAILRYDGILDLAGELDVAEDASIEVTSAESVQVQQAARR